MDSSKLIPIFKALADDIRLAIIGMLKNGDLCANEILASFSITQPTLSYHMKMLTGSGLVKSRKEGAKTVYSLVAGSLQVLSEYASSYAAPSSLEPVSEPQPEEAQHAPIRRQMDSYLL